METLVNHEQTWLWSWFFRGDSNFLKARQEAKKGELDEQLREYINEWRKQRSKEEEELKRLKEKQAKRKEIRAEQEKKLAQQKKEEEERMRKEEADKKAKEAEEKRKRLEEAEKKRQAMMNAQKVKFKLLFFLYTRWRFSDCVFTNLSAICLHLYIARFAH